MPDLNGYPLGVIPSPPDERSGIYQIVNKTNKKRYVGSAVNLRQRWALHRSDLRLGKHHNGHLQASWNIYGEAAFSFEVLEYVAHPGRLVGREQYHMDSLRPEYNLAPLAGSPLGMVRSEESRQRMRAAQLGKTRGPMSESQKRKLSAAHKGKVLSEEHRARLSEAHTGQALSAEQCQSMSKATKALWTNPEYRRKITESSTGRVASEATKREMSAAHRGEQNPRAKLTHQAVKEIHDLLSKDTYLQREIGDMYGVCRAAIAQIKRGANWAHVSVGAGGEEE